MGAIKKSLAGVVLFVSVTASEAQDTPYELERLGVQAAGHNDWVAAQKYLKQAAEMGDYTSQFEYAFLLETSDPPVKDLVQAYAWYTIVILRKGPNTDTAETCIARVAKNLNTAEIERAKAEAQILLARYGR